MKKKIIILIVSMALLFWILIVICDYNRFKNNLSPVFCPIYATYDFIDGYANECRGLGYKIIDYHRENLEKKTFTPFWTKLENNSNLVDDNCGTGETNYYSEKNIIDIAYNYLSDEGKESIENKCSAKVSYQELSADTKMYAVKIDGTQIIIENRKIISIDFEGKNKNFIPNNIIVAIDKETKELLGFPFLD